MFRCKEYEYFFWVRKLTLNDKRNWMEIALRGEKRRNGKNKDLLSDTLLKRIHCPVTNPNGLFVMIKLSLTLMMEILKQADLIKP